MSHLEYTLAGVGPDFSARMQSTFSDNGQEGFDIDRWFRALPQWRRIFYMGLIFFAVQSPCIFDDDLIITVPPNCTSSRASLEATRDVAKLYGKDPQEAINKCNQ